MTPTQKAALDALAGRTLSAQDEAAIDAALAAGNWNAIVAIVSSGRVKTGGFTITERQLLEQFPAGPQAADAFIAKMETFAAGAGANPRLVRRLLDFMRMPEGVDAGAQNIRDVFVGLRNASVITSDELNGLVAVVTKPDPVTKAQVAAALQE